MSNIKITSKNLSYNSTLPPFLQRLQANNGSSDGRHEFAISRPSKKRDEDEERESEPVVFDEVSGETLSREEWEQREKERGEEGKADAGEEEGKDGEAERKEKMGEMGGVGIGASKKRKVGKVIGGSEDEGEDLAKPNNKSSNKKVTGKQKNEENNKPGTGGKQKPKASTKKGKKMKLSFGDDE